MPRSAMDRSLSSSSTYMPKAYLLSHAEQRLFMALRKALGARIHIAPKVRLADIVVCNANATDFASLSRISQKHVDFVLLDPKSSRLLAAVELDDRTHLTLATRRRDEFVNELLNAVGLPLLRVQAAYEYNRYVLQQQLALALSKRGRPSPRASLARLRRKSLRAGVRAS